MSFQSFPYNFPTAALALIDLKTGQPTNFFWQFLLSLFNRSGGSDGIGPIVKTGLTAVGTTQATALALGADWNQVTSAPAALAPFNGVVLPAMSPGNDIWVWNADPTLTHTLNVYPFSGTAIGSGAANAAYPLGSGLLAHFQCWSTTQIVPVIKVNPLTL